jgi:hypothetical protein
LQPGSLGGRRPGPADRIRASFNRIDGAATRCYVAEPTG